MIGLWIVIIQHYFLAEAKGFEPLRAVTLPPFQGGALDHYATLPSVICNFTYRF